MRPLTVTERSSEIGSGPSTAGVKAVICDSATMRMRRAPVSSEICSEMAAAAAGRCRNAVTTRMTRAERRPPSVTTVSATAP